MSLVERPATELAAMIRSGEATSRQVVEAHLDRIRRYDRRIHAVVSLREREVLAEADAADQAVRDGRPLGPLHGLPATLKDSTRVGGVRTVFGMMPQYLRHVPKADCAAVGRLRAAGMLVLGRSNLPLMALDWQCRNPLFAETVNPWDAARTSGGSSGGSAAGLACGFTPLELGSDLGGSIRYPAHCCGVVGLRTSDGLLPIDDFGPESDPPVFHRDLALGPMARTLGDVALMLDALVLPEAPAVRRPVDRLRVAVTRSFDGARPSEATLETVDRVALALRAQGHEVVDASPDADNDELYRILCATAAYDLARAMERQGALMGSTASKWLVWAYVLRYKLGDGPFARHMREGLFMSRAAYDALLERRLEIRRLADGFFERHDLWILPVARGEAIPRQRWGRPFLVDGETVSYSAYLGAYTVPTTVYGTPVLTIPAGRSKEGLPIGLQLHGPRYSDRWLVDVAQRHLAPFAEFRPPPL